MAEKDRKQERETGRLESFSDGIFAFAITLLVLGLHDPIQASNENLFTGLLNQWPVFFAFLTSFTTILIIWVIHHTMFNFIRRIDIVFMFLNGFMLLFVTLNPFTTSLIAAHLLDSNSSRAAAVYSGSFIALSILWYFSWRHASDKHRLLFEHVTDTEIKRVDRAFAIGTLLYVFCFALAWVNGLASTIAVLFLAIFWGASAASTYSVGLGKS